ncbi:MAG: hypothetical protein WCX12_00245 [Candidatus Paceibacterota bacterium]|jgi:hypothetical protein
MSVKITLLGSLPKGDEARKQFKDWKIEYEEKIRATIPNSNFLHGDLVSDTIGPELVVGHDLWLIKNSDIIVVNASSKIGAGTAQEILYAKYCKKPVVSVLPKNTHHRRSNVVFQGTAIEDWIHPFIFVSSDYIAETLEDAANWIALFIKTPTPVKGITIFEEVTKQFEKEFPDIVSEYKNKGW